MRKYTIAVALLCGTMTWCTELDQTDALDQQDVVDIPVQIRPFAHAATPNEVIRALKNQIKTINSALNILSKRRTDLRWFYFALPASAAAAMPFTPISAFFVKSLQVSEYWVHAMPFLIITGLTAGGLIDLLHYIAVGKTQFKQIDTISKYLQDKHDEYVATMTVLQERPYFTELVKTKLDLDKDLRYTLSILDS